MRMPREEFSSSLARIRGEFEEVMKEIRPELHRYCARIVGSAIDGEDVVQEALAKAFYSLPTMTVTNIKSWLMRIAHNKAIDFLRREGRQRMEHADEFPVSDEPDRPLEKKEILTYAVSLFLKLTPKQRSCVVLKDVLDYSLAEISELLDSSVPEIKAALHRGRARLRQLSADATAERPVVVNEQDRELIARYVERFNVRDYDSVRAMLSEEVRLDLVGRAQRRGGEVREYFSRYAEIPYWRFALGTVEGRLAILGYDTRISSTSEARPGYFILLEWKEGRVSLIRDYVFAPYVIREAEVREGGA
jgi:RNA polymerase sigma-70 factor, ECF subfamily